MSNEYAEKLLNWSEQIFDMNPVFKSETLDTDALSNSYWLPSVDAMPDASESLDESIPNSSPLPCTIVTFTWH